MTFYLFSQNNSGGIFHRDHDVDEIVIIEAENADEANEKAEEIGIYFDGCDAGRDCECCGDRWYPAWGDNGSEKPEIYGEGAEDGFDGYRVIIHYANGNKASYNILD